MRILFVEDEEKLRELIARALKAERYAVDVANDGNAGWSLAGPSPWPADSRSFAVP
jgi:DNA-binding response OmpR family regulator